MALGLTLAGGAIYWLTRPEMLRIYARMAGQRSEPQLKAWTALAEACGGAFYFFLLLFVAAAILAIALKKQDEPFASERQKLTA